MFTTAVVRGLNRSISTQVNSRSASLVHSYRALYTRHTSPSQYTLPSTYAPTRNISTAQIQQNMALTMKPSAYRPGTMRMANPLVQSRISTTSSKRSFSSENASIFPPHGDGKTVSKIKAHEERWAALPWYKKPFISKKYVHPGEELPVSFRGVWAVLILSVLGSLYLKYRETKTVSQAKVLTYQVSGKLDIGGPFDGLYDTEGKEATSEQYKGLYPLIYFGFANCPDICPTELRKMMAALDIIEQKSPDVYPYIKPIFISVDPLRDTRERLAEYSKGYHPRIRWLTGTYEKLLEVAKRYRVYFSIPEDATPDSEYNVDHSIFFFLMDRKGELLQYYGQNKTAAEIAELMSGVVREDLMKREEESSEQ